MSPVTTTSLACDQCDFEGKSPQSLAMHRMRAHDGRGGPQRAIGMVDTSHSEAPRRPRGRPRADGLVSGSPEAIEADRAKKKAAPRKPRAVAVPVPAIEEEEHFTPNLFDEPESQVLQEEIPSDAFDALTAEPRREWRELFELADGRVVLADGTGRAWLFNFRTDEIERLNLNGGE